MTELEAKIKAKIPGPDTGIEIKHSLCAICSPAHHCGVDCYVKDGKIIRVEGTPEHPYNHGKLCTKGSSLRNYVYRKDRLKTPLRRVGARGEGKFEPISWDEAYKIIAENLNRVKAQYSPHAVVFYSGYCKWYRPLYHRFAYTFGSINFGTDDSTCSASADIANKIMCGGGAGGDMGNANTFLGWNYDGYYSGHLSVQGVQNLKARGGKVIIIDIRKTPAAKNLADIFLQINPGTDGALALGMAKLILDNGWADMDYIQKYTYGFEAYRDMVQEYTLEKTSAITGLTQEEIYAATKLYATNGPACCNYSSSALVHHINGFNTHRAIFCLSALTGNLDRKGGNAPNPPTYIHKSAGFKTCEMEFRTERKPTDQRPIGGERFPLWEAQFDECQMMDMLRQIEEDKPYPIRAFFGLGFNAKMFPETDRLLKAMSEKLDFIVNTDLFMTMSCKYADIVLPACSSVERSELKAYGGGYLVYTQPVIKPLYDSKPDVDILCDLARVMDLDDEYLKSGYEACIDHIIEGCGLTVADLKKSPLPMKVPAAKWPVPPGNWLKNGFGTKTGKFEFSCTAIEEIDPKYGLDPLPSYTDPLADENDPETRKNYPFYLCTGPRQAHAIHSRTMGVPWLRSLCPYPTCQINEQDARTLGIADGDKVEISSPSGTVFMRAHLTSKIKSGVVLTLHGYTEANINNLIGCSHLDPYSGYPGFKGCRCMIRRAEDQTT